jgi:hypothetical protein
VKDSVALKEYRLSDIVADKIEPSIIQKSIEIALRPREEIINSDNFMIQLYKLVTKV